MFSLIRLMPFQDAFGVRGLSDSRPLRAPEVILGAPHGTSADLWSLGCIVSSS